MSSLSLNDKTKGSTPCANSNEFSLIFERICSNDGFFEGLKVRYSEINLIQNEVMFSDGDERLICLPTILSLNDCLGILPAKMQCKTIPNE